MLNLLDRVPLKMDGNLVWKRGCFLHLRFQDSVSENFACLRPPDVSGKP
jgi:hypothetical protein